MKAKNKFNFTNKSIAKLEPTTKRELFYDEKETNLALAVNPSGKKTYLVVMSVNNKTVKRSIGMTDNLSLDEARAEAADFRSTTRKTGRVPEKDAPKGEPSVYDLYEAYMRKHAKKRLKDWSYLERYWVRHLSCFKSHKASDLSRTKVENWFENTAEKSGKHMANRLLWFLGAIYKKADEFKLYCGTSPTKGIQKHKELSRDRYLKKEELEVLRKTLDEEPCHGFRSFVKLSLMTGARFSNVVGMRWSDLDLIEGNSTWTIPAEEFKNGEAATIHLTKEAVAVILEHRSNDQGEYVLHKDVALGTIKRRWRANFDRLVNRAKISNFRIHDMRRTFGSKLAQEGVSLQKIAKALGQKSTRATPVYARLNDAAVREAVESIEGYFTF